MGKSITYTEKFFAGSSLIDLGYRDYIAARFLLNNQFVVQGLTLASTAVEKYLKSLIVFNLEEKEKYNYHFDNLEKLRNLLSKLNHNVLEAFDPVFLEVLENAFKIRYYDKIEKPLFIGIYLNQFIGELDYTIDFLERLIMKTHHGETSITPYMRGSQNNDPHLYKNNYVLNKQNKKAFMENPDNGYSIYIHIGGAVQSKQIVKAENIVNKYEGRISEFTEFQPNLYIKK